MRRYRSGGNTGYKTSDEVLGAGKSVRASGQSVRGNTIPTGTGAKAQMAKQKKIVAAQSKKGANIKMAKFPRATSEKSPDQKQMDIHYQL